MVQSLPEGLDGQPLEHRGPCKHEDHYMLLSGYLERLGLAAGTLILFDRRPRCPSGALAAAAQDGLMAERDGVV